MTNGYHKPSLLRKKAAGNHRAKPRRLPTTRQPKPRSGER